MKTDKVIGKVYATEDYDRFGEVHGNREDIMRRAKAYMPSIKKVGQVCPIVVNELGQVIDGQARLECCKQLKIPVEYFIKPGLRLGDVIEANTNSTKWKTIEVVHAKGVMGNETAKYMDQLKKQFPKMSPEIIFRALTGRGISSHRIKDAVDIVQVDFDDYNRAVDHLDYVVRLTEIIKGVDGRKQEFQSVVLWLLARDRIDRNRLMKAVSRRVSTMYPMASIKVAAEQIQEVYNFNQRTRVRFADEIAELVENRQFGEKYGGKNG